MVSKLLKLCFGLVFLVTVIHGNFDALERKLNNMAQEGENILNLFVPYKNGTIRRSNISLVYEGGRLEDHHRVALKFVNKGQRKLTKHEFKMYSYLNATDNIAVERYGISAIHYFQECYGFMLIVFSFFDRGDVFDLGRKGYFKHEKERLAINSLILFRNFVLQSKYIHSHGVRHNDIKPAHIAVRLGRSFLIDFALASKMMEDNGLGTYTFLAREACFERIRNPKSDWESFLYTMAYINQIELGWMFGEQYPGLSRSFANMMATIMKSMTDSTIEKIENAPIKSQQLRRVFLEFAKETFDDSNPIPNYDRLYEFITGQIEQLITPHQNALFTWIKDKDKEAAMHDLEQASFDIAGIPYPLDNYDGFEYPRCNFDFFPKPILEEQSHPDQCTIC